MDEQRQAGRVAWVDYAKGICIVLVVMMHATLGVEAASGTEGWMHSLIVFAKPFRMPDFFLLSGLFLARTIDRDWGAYLDRKVVHFAYFYVLWLTIQLAFKAPGIAANEGAAAALWLYAEAFIQPFGTLWFIYLLPVFFVATKLVRRVPTAIVWSAAALLEIAPIATGSVIIDEFASRFVYFYTGYALAPRIFAFADAVRVRAALAGTGLALWAILNGALVAGGQAEWPVVSLALGYLGALAVVAVSALFAKAEALPALRYCGRNSIVIYLAFFLPMAASRTLLLKTGLVPDVGLASALVTLAGIVGALAIFWAVRGTRLKLLFERPASFRFARTRSSLQPAE